MTLLHFAIAVGVVALLTWAVCKLRRRFSQGGGFWDYVKNLTWRDYYARELARKREAIESPPLDDETIYHLVEKLLEVKDRDYVKQRLSAQKERALPSLLQALADPRYHRAKMTDDYREETPLERILDLIRPFAPHEAAQSLVPLIQRDRPDCHRKAAAAVLGAIGSDECIAPIQGVLKGSDDSVQHYAMNGIAEAVKEGRASPAFREAMFDAIVPLVSRRNMTASETAPRILLLLNKEKAVALLLDDRFFTPANQELHHILWALKCSEVPVPTAKLLNLIKGLREVADKYPGSYAYGYALLLLARTSSCEAERIIRESLTMPYEKVRECATQALCILNGLPADPTEVVWKQLKALGVSGLTEPQRILYHVSILKSEVENGGLAQYFVNSSGEQAREALAALKVINAVRSAEALAKAITLFGGQGPSRDHRERHHQMASLGLRQEEVWEPLNRAFCDPDDPLNLRIMLYAISHAADFRQTNAH